MIVRIFQKNLAAPYAVRQLTLLRRGFKVLGIQQVAIGGLCKKELSNFWADTLGITKVGTYRAEKENVDEDILSLGDGPCKIEIDLMQPIDPTKSPKVQSPALNHIGLWVDDLPEAVKTLESKGVRLTPGGIRKGAGVDRLV